MPPARRTATHRPRSVAAPPEAASRAWRSLVVFSGDVQPLGQLCLARDQRDHEAEQAHALDVIIDEQAMLRAVRDVHYANELVMPHEWETDERAGREILVAEQRMRYGVLSGVHHQQQFTGLGDFPRDADADRDDRALLDVRGEPAAGGEVENAGISRHAKKKRAPVCLHVVADEREQSLREALRLFARRGERERTIEKVDRARALAQRFAPAVKLAVRLLERSNRGGELLLEHDELSRRSAGVLGDARIVALPREQRGRLGGNGVP